MTRKLILPLLAGVAIYFALFGGEYSVFEVRRARVERAVAEEQLAELREEILVLRARVEALESDPAELERIAREKFGMIRDGEVLYRLVPDADPAEADDEADQDG